MFVTANRSNYFSGVSKYQKRTMHFKNVILSIKVTVNVKDFLVWSQSWASRCWRLSFLPVIFFDLVLLLKLQIELSGIHRSRSRVTEAKRSREDDAPLCYLVTNQPIRA